MQIYANPKTNENHKHEINNIIQTQIKEINANVLKP